MDPATINLIQTIATDAIKILGPAIIAAYATYYASKAHFQTKLKELDKTNEFSARKCLFDFYKERQEKLQKEYEKLTESLGQSVGFAAGVEEDDDQTIRNMLSTYTEMVLMHSKLTPVEIETTLRDMRQHNLESSSEYKKLESYIKRIKDLKPGATFDVLRENVFEIVEAYHFMLLCSHMVLQRQMDKVFSKYVSGPNM